MWNLDLKKNQQGHEHKRGAIGREPAGGGREKKEGRGKYI
jgi:hypothetical protein